MLMMSMGFAAGLASTDDASADLVIGLSDGSAVSPLTEYLSAPIIGLLRRQRYTLPIGLALVGVGMLLIGCGLLCRPEYPNPAACQPSRRSHLRRKPSTTTNSGPASGDAVDHSEGCATPATRRALGRKARRWQRLEREDGEADQDVELGPAPHESVAREEALGADGHVGDGPEERVDDDAPAAPAAAHTTDDAHADVAVQALAVRADVDELERAVAAHRDDEVYL